MLQVRVLELGSICLETSTKDQCEKYTFKHEITTATEIKEWIPTNLNSWSDCTLHIFSL